MTDYCISFFEEIAKGGAAAVTVGDTEVNSGEADVDPFGLYFNLRGREGRAVLSELSDAVRQHGAHVSVQLNHIGALTLSPPGSISFGPSSFKRPDGVIVQGMTEEKIQDTIQQFVHCARVLKQQGFSMCMLHGAHGWLLSQFLSPKHNQRTDQYGGSFENRTRFPIAVLNAVRETVGENFLIEYRISGKNPLTEQKAFEELIAYIKLICSKIDILHVSSGAMDIDASSTFPTYLDKRGVNIHLAEAIKKEIDIPVAVVGAISDPDMAEEVIANGKADFVAMARALIADPKFPKKARRGATQEIRSCIGCYNCLELMHNRHLFGCDVNPRAGREHRIGPLLPTYTKRKVVVVGGGPAGMQAAITASQRGHRVILFEKTSALGGILKITDFDPLKYLLKKYKDYLITQIGKQQIEVRLNTEATVENVESESPDAIIIAAGSTPIIPSIPGALGNNVYSAIQAHMPDTRIGKKVVIVGGNLVGCETAISMKAKGKKVTIVEMSDQLYADANHIIGLAIQKRLENIDVIVSSKCIKISDNGATIENRDGRHLDLPADSVILAVGMRPEKEIVGKFQLSAFSVSIVGDCLRPGNIRQAIHTAFFAALDID